MGLPSTPADNDDDDDDDDDDAIIALQQCGVSIRSMGFQRGHDAGQCVVANAVPFGRLISNHSNVHLLLLHTMNQATHAR